MPPPRKRLRNYGNEAGRHIGQMQYAQALSNPPEPLMEAIPDWTKLSRDDDIALHSGGRELASGRVDMRALDGSVLWIIQHDGKGRAMFLHSDGLIVFRRPPAKDKPSRRVSSEG